MNWSEFTLARLLMAEERVGSPIRQHDRAELAADEQTKAIIRSQGM